MLGAIGLLEDQDSHLCEGILLRRVYISSSHIHNCCTVTGMFGMLKDIV